MQSESQDPPSNEKMLEISLALAELRDSWVKLSLVLGEIVTDHDSTQREEVLIEVKRYLVRLRETAR